ncbi:MAG: hypothetical protein CMM58_11850 [Rhodospirillaceae bacterium]|nr:hypothetical protein [Rhodospirillaceae bacterium]
MENRVIDDEIVVANSATKLGVECAGRVVLGASHGAVYAAYLVVRSGARGVILNDAGRAKDNSGISGGDYCANLDVPFAATDTMSCRIGNGESAAREGIISYANGPAISLGVVIGMPAIDAAHKLTKAPMNEKTSPEYSEARKELPITSDGKMVVLMDSISLVTKQDEGRIIVSGSHGGMLGKDPATALKYDAFAGFFHDAGIGKDGAGISRLMPLNDRGIVAATVEGMSARIGDGGSIYSEGIISHLNGMAKNRGGEIGMPLKDFISILTHE